MKKCILIMPLSFLGLLFGVYNVGQTVSINDQNVSLDICYGNYPTDTFSLADLNGDLNGGEYHVIFMDMTASW